MMETADVHALQDRYPLLTDLLHQAYYPDWVQEFIDHTVAIASGLHEIKRDDDPDLSSLRKEVVAVLTGYHTETALHEVSEALSMYSEPEGRSYRRWFERILRQIDQGPHTYPNWKMPGLPRASRFTDEATANQATTLVLRRNEPLARDWVEDRLGFRRAHLYADTGRPIGVVIEAADPDRRREVSGCVVVMRKNPENAQPYIATAYPEVPLDEATRSAYPDLPHLFGAHFSQDYDGIDGGIWRGEVNFHVGAAGAAKQRVADQLDALLAATPDHELAAALTALGSYVLPEPLRPWVERIRERITDTAMWAEPG